MQCRVRPSPALSATIQIPSSKSHTHRALLFAFLADGTSTIDRFLASPDTECMIGALELLGAKITRTGTTLSVLGTGGKVNPATNVINAGNSGIILRFVGAIASLGDTFTVITGDESIRTRRPVKPLLDALQQLGVFAESSRQNDHAPIIIKGPLTGGTCEIDGSDSQPVSGLIIAAAFAGKETTILVRNPGEKPFIDMTLSWLARFGIPYQISNYTSYELQGGASLSGFQYTVPGDFSSLAFPVAAALITNSEVTINNVDLSDVQGDKKLLMLLQEMGAKFVFDGDSMLVKPSMPLVGRSFDINDIIDSVPILAVIGCYSEGALTISNAQVAREKECDRIHCIAVELLKMGADITELNDGLVVRRSKLHGATLETYNDHRMAMSLAVAALGAEGDSIINGMRCASKTYPTFVDDMVALGANMQLLQN